MSEENGGGVVLSALLGLAASPGVIAAGVTLWRWWVERGDKKTERVLTREERLQSELDERQAAMSKRDAEALRWMREENDRCRSRVIEVEAQRDEAYQNADAAWDIARGWKERCHQLKHDLDNARTAANAGYMQLGHAPHVWAEEQLPALDQIIEDNARRMAERRSIYGRHPPDDTSDG